MMNKRIKSPKVKPALLKRFFLSALQVMLFLSEARVFADSLSCSTPLIWNPADLSSFSQSYLSLVGSDSFVVRSGKLGIGTSAPTAILTLVGPSPSPSSLFLIRISPSPSPLFNLGSSGDVTLGAMNQNVQINATRVNITGNMNVTSNVQFSGSLNATGALNLGDTNPSTSSSFVPASFITLAVRPSPAPATSPSPSPFPSPSPWLSIQGVSSSSTEAALRITNASGLNILTVTNSGNVSMGPTTSWPDKRLSIYGHVRVSSGFIQIPTAAVVAGGTSVKSLCNADCSVCTFKPAHYFPRDLWCDTTMIGALILVAGATDAYYQGPCVCNGVDWVTIYDGQSKCFQDPGTPPTGCTAANCRKCDP